MLTVDLVNVRRRGRELHVVPLDAGARARATELAAVYLEIAEAHVGASRDELSEALSAVEVQPRERRLADGLCKLVEDRCQLDAESAVDPEELRAGLFARASAERRAGLFDRAALIAEHAAALQLAPEEVEHALYADLRGAHTLKAIEPIAPARLVEEYDLAQAQAVLLRAARVTVDVECRTPGQYRALFHKLKFLRLLYTIQPRPGKEGGYRLEIDGPFSLFESVTRYGLSLALALPALRECDRFRLEAEVRWGKDRLPLTFKLEGSLDSGSLREPALGMNGEGRPKAKAEPPRLADEVERLLADLGAVESEWRARPSTDILELPGIGLCVPDLVLEHGRSGECVYLEVLGFWSREAVWRRVELVERGLPQRILFAVSAKLRVSEAALGDEQPGALYVYKRVMSARAVLERVEALASKPVAARAPRRRRQ